MLIWDPMAIKFHKKFHPLLLIWETKAIRNSRVCGGDAANSMPACLCVCLFCSLAYLQLKIDWKWISACWLHKSTLCIYLSIGYFTQHRKGVQHFRCMYAYTSHIQRLMRMHFEFCTHSSFLPSICPIEIFSIDDLFDKTLWQPLKTLKCL